MRNVTLLLENGKEFHGKSFGYDSPVAGEVVFNTAMMGYPESH
jgi:carbamoyl-phosphate synthase small subunit